MHLPVDLQALGHLGQVYAVGGPGIPGSQVPCSLYLYRSSFPHRWHLFSSWEVLSSISRSTRHGLETHSSKQPQNARRN